MNLGHRMAAEMAEQPAAVHRLVTAFTADKDVVSRWRPAPGRGVLLLARGSSDHAAVFGRYVLEWALGTPVVLAAPSLMTRYGRVPQVDGWLTVAISQSGRTPEIVEALRLLRAAGSRALAVTNEPGTPLAAQADHTVVLGTGEETAVPATKTVSASFAALALLADALSDGLWSTDDWSCVEAAMREALADSRSVEGAAEIIARHRGSVHLGRGFGYAAALESALKLKESSALPSEGASVADFLHGPIAAAAGRPVVCYSLAGPTEIDVADVAGRLHAEGSAVVAVGAELPSADVTLRVAPGVPEPLAVLPLLVRAQQLALAVARLVGVDPDQPVGLNKITRTS